MCRPLQLSGLSVRNLALAGVALRTRWLWLQKIEQDHVWSELQMPTELEVQALFNAVVRTEVGDDARILFWEDPWLEGGMVVARISASCD